MDFYWNISGWLMGAQATDEDKLLIPDGSGEVEDSCQEMKRPEDRTRLYLK